MKAIAIFLFLIVWLCFGCDPVRRIDMKNETGDTVRFVWTLRKDSVLLNPFMMSNSRELVFTLHPSKASSVNLSFGAGRWAPTDVERLANHLELLEIFSAKQHLKIDSVPQLKEFMLARRKGIGGARIVIAVSE